MPLPKSFVCDYFSRVGDKAHCKLTGCNAIFTTKATTPLSYHLLTAHKISKDSGKATNSSSSATVVNTTASTSSEAQAQVQVEAVPDPVEGNEPQSGSTCKKQKTMLECYSFKILEETVSRLAAKDGMTIRQITRSQFIRSALTKEFPTRTIPKNESNMIVLMKTFYAQTKNLVKQNYDERRERGPLLEKLFTALCSIPPTSTQSERNFSLSGIFVSKLRRRFTPKHVDMFSFLKSQFLHSI